MTNDFASLNDEMTCHLSSPAQPRSCAQRVMEGA
jgi:hypothetical protein